MDSLSIRRSASRHADSPDLSAGAMEHGVTVSVSEACNLDEIASVIADAIAAWPASARLKRCALPVLAYDEQDLRDHEVLLLSAAGKPLAVAAWQTSATMADPQRRNSTLLHGLYVAKGAQLKGLGCLLQGIIASRAHEAGFNGLHVKAERYAVGYFRRCGYLRLESGQQPGDGRAEYPNWFWQECATIKTLARPKGGSG